MRMSIRSGITILLCCIALLISCRLQDSRQPGVSITMLSEYETIVAYQDTVLAVPAVLALDDSVLFVYDKAQKHIVKLNSSGDVLATMGRAGRGPGEFVSVSSMFVTGEYVYAVDDSQYLVQRYQRDGTFSGQMDYAKVGGFGRPNVPAAPQSVAVIQTEQIDNRPAVTSRGEVLLSGVNFRDSTNYLYKRFSWQGRPLSAIGEVPEGTMFFPDYDSMRTEIANREVPSFERGKVFPVINRGDTASVFLVYSAYPKIERYRMDGERLWEREVPFVHENDSLRNRYYRIMEDMVDHEERIGLSYYVSGVSTPSGGLFLATTPEPLWIHQFDEKGMMVRRYRFDTDGVNMASIFDVDWARQRIVVVTGDAEVRAYPLDQSSP